MTQPSPPGLAMHIGMRGRFRLVLNKGTACERDTGWFDNLITDAGLDKLGGSADNKLFVSLSVGTGSAAPASGDTALGGFVASASISGASIVQSNSGAPAFKAQFVATYAFAVGAVVGTIAEVGVGWKPDGTGLWSRSLIVDVNGAAAPLTILAIDQLTVYYQLSCTPTMADVAGALTLSGKSYSYVGRISTLSGFFTNLYTSLTVSLPLLPLPGNIYVYPAASVLGAASGGPSGTGSKAGTVGPGSYVPGTKYLDSVLTFLPAVANVAGGIGCISVSYCTGAAMTYQYKFTPPIPKTASMTMTLTLRVAWDRA